MKIKFALAGISIAALLASPPAIAQGTNPPVTANQQGPSSAEADAEVERLEAALRVAREAQAARNLEAARRDAEVARARAAEAEARVANLNPPPAAAQPRGETGQNGGAGTQNGNNSNNNNNDNTKFGGLEFGVGLSFTLDVGTSDRVGEAELVNGIVRVKDENNGVARIMLESHYFFTPERELFGVAGGRWGHGPFVAIQPGTDDIIQAIGAGWMIGFQRPTPPSGEDSGQSFNIGLGVVVDPNTRILGDGIVANQPLPAGETAIRYTEEMQIGALLLFSFSF